MSAQVPSITEATEFQLCGRCKNMKVISNYEVNANGNRQKCCLDCKRKSIESHCDHGRQRSLCVPCGGRVSICDHGRARTYCRNCDSDGHLKHNITNRIIKSIGKGKGAFNVLGCSIQDFRAHIEEQFENPGNEWMSWDNYGEWEIDHAIPLQFEVVSGVPPTLDEITQRCHWSNTQPLRKCDNMSKGNHRVDIVKKPRLHV